MLSASQRTWAAIEQDICLPLLWVVYSILMLTSATFYFKEAGDSPMQSVTDVQLAPGLSISAKVA